MREHSMPALGQKRTSRSEITMSALTPKADIAGRQLHVRFVPKADIEPPHSITSSARARSEGGTHRANLTQQKSGPTKLPTTPKGEHGYEPTI
jgi:hypothetical protein